MDKKQLALLGICNFTLSTVGGGLTGLLPVYLTRLGADATVTGLFLAFVFLALAVSNVVGGRLSDRWQRRKPLLIAGGLLAVPFTLLMSGAVTVFLLTVLAGLVWFVSGLANAMVSVLAGLGAAEGERGRVFGILGVCTALGSLFGGLASGTIADRWGYQALFTLAGLFYLILPAAGLFLKDRHITQARREPSSGRVSFNRTLLLLTAASALAHAANSEIVLCRPLLMNQLHFDATAISNAGGIGALIILPLPLLVGWLSDRLGRKPFLMLCYLTTALGLLILAAATREWHFWAASALQSALGVSVIVGSALITDRTPKTGLGASLSLFTATPWVGFVLGFGGGGTAISALQLTPTLLLGVGLTLLAVGLIMPISGTASRPMMETA